MTGILNIQLKPTVGNKELNLKKVEHFIKKHSDKKLDLIVLPEFFSTGVDMEFMSKFPEDENGGEVVKFMQTLAKRYDTNIAAGTVIEKDGENLYNTTFLINRQGEIVEKYRKIHLFNCMGGAEDKTITAGDRVVVADSDIGKIGMSICFDMRYPLHYNKLAKAGAEIIISPTAWEIPNEIYNDSEALKYAQQMWVAINRTRAYDNGVFLVSSNLTGKAEENLSCLGSSLVVSPTSRVLSDAGNFEGGNYCQIDLQEVKYLRSVFPIE